MNTQQKIIVYMLECADKSLYTGWTNDIENRLKAHNLGIGGKYTRSRLPVKLVYCETVSSKSEALKREFAIKKMKRSAKLALTSGNESRKGRHPQDDFGR